jgi:hypothetical protein
MFAIVAISFPFAGIGVGLAFLAGGLPGLAALVVAVAALYFELDALNSTYKACTGQTLFGDSI